MEKRTKKATKQLLSYLEQFYWLKLSIEENVAGYLSVLEHKGEAAYGKHCRACKAKAKLAQNLNEALQIYREWLKFFCNSHIG
ncbi:MAG: hypothetical protein PHO32_03385 [Candidatus Cloacimonetes bacterium]|nr:hypothetical protein [Candidatus Cloacimonadota bacterium]